MLELCQRKVLVAKERHSKNYITVKMIGIPGAFFSLNQLAHLDEDSQPGKRKVALAMWF